jgi:uncharacterized protein YaaR (DUF327 family)
MTPKTEQKKDKNKKKTSDKPETTFAAVLGETEERINADESLEQGLALVYLADQDLRSNLNFDNLDKYKKAVKEFMDIVTGQYLRLRQKPARRKNRSYTILEQVGDALKRLETDMKNSLNFNVAARLDEIRGLLVDVKF